MVNLIIEYIEKIITISGINREKINYIKGGESQLRKYKSNRYIDRYINFKRRADK